MSKRWYVVHAYSGYEKRVMNTLKERIELHSACRISLVRCWCLPKRLLRFVTVRKRKSERKFYPGYVLVHMDMNDESWHLVKNTPHVLGFIGGTAGNPAPITEAEANEILSRVESGVDKPRPKTVFEPGEMVRVVDGPFADFDGVVEEVNYEKNKLQVAVLIFGRTTPVELDFVQVEKA